MNSIQFLMYVTGALALLLVPFFIPWTNPHRREKYRPRKVIRQLKGACPTCRADEKTWCAPHCTALDLYDRGM